MQESTNVRTGASFANPAITIGRSLSDAFAGIRPADVSKFITAQVRAGLLGMLVARSLIGSARSAGSPDRPA